MKIKHFWLWAVLLVSVPYLFIIDQALQVPQSWDNLIMGDIVDQPLITSGLARAERFSDTFTWWTGSWVMGDVYKYYRPLMSLIWWFEYQLFGGMSGVYGFTAVHVLLHLAVCLLMVEFVRRLTHNDTIALLTGGLWMGCLMDYLTVSINFTALSYWKNDPEMWGSLAMLGCLLALLGYARNPNKRALVAVFAFQLIGISIKEHAYVLPFLALALLWHERQLQKWQVPAAMLALTIIAFAYRFWALQGMGWSYGKNGSWLYRWLMNVWGGRPLSGVSVGEIAPVAIALILIAVWMLHQRHFKTAAIVGGLGGFGVLWNEIQWPGEIFSRLILPLVAEQFSSSLVIYTDTLLALVFFLTWLHFISRRERTAYFAFMWIAITYMPLMRAVVGGHALYLTSMGWALWGALAIKALVQWGWPKVIGLKTPQLQRAVSK